MLPRKAALFFFLSALLIILVVDAMAWQTFHYSRPTERKNGLVWKYIVLRFTEYNGPSIYDGSVYFNKTADAERAGQFYLYEENRNTITDILLDRWQLPLPLDHYEISQLDMFPGWDIGTWEFRLSINEIVYDDNALSLYVALTVFTFATLSLFVIGFHFCNSLIIRHRWMM